MSTIKEHRSSIGAHIHRQPLPAKKVHFQLPNNLKSTLLDFINDLNHRPYQDLVCIIRDSEVKDEDLCLLLQDAQDCVSLLNQKLRLFIQVLLIVKWAHRGPEAVATFQNFLLDLCSAHSYHTEAVLSHLIRFFKMVLTDGPDSPSDLPSPDEERMYQNVHRVLKRLLKVVPLAGQALLPSIAKEFPYMKSSTKVYQAYVHNLLEILKYQPKYRKDFLHLITFKIVELDVNAPRDKIEEAEAEGMDIDSEDIFSLDRNEGMKLQVANTLDHVMMKVFQFIESQCIDPATSVTSLEKCYDVYKEFQQVFEKVILPTHNTHHVQYIMWYICSLKPKLAEVYVKYLWQQVTSVHVIPVTRQSAAAYVSSFLARAKFIRIEFLKTVLQDMSDWIHSYINNQDGQKTVEIRMHSVFYSVCQGLFYLLCFKHKDLFRTKQNMVFLRGLNLTKVVTCSLNPLKVCLPEIVKKFASITRAYQLLYCNSVIERNARSCIPMVHSKNHVMHTVQPTSSLDAFFPFDPYKLHRSSSVINPNYNVYQDEDVVDDVNQKVDNDEDDFLHEAMSVTVKDRRFTYSASPGFLQDHPSNSTSPHLRHYI